MIDWSALTPEELLLKLSALPDNRQLVSGFLDTHQFAPLLGSPGLQIGGGHPNAQFRIATCGSLPELTFWCCLIVNLAPSLRSVRALRQAWRLANRQAWEIGDIVLGGEQCWLVSLPDVPVGDVLPAFRATGEQSPPQTAAERITVASLRADAVLAPLFKVSRAEAQTAIEYGFVFRNFLPLQLRTASVKAGDQLVYRTKGRIEIAGLEHNSKSGRNWIRFLRFPC